MSDDTIFNAHPCTTCKAVTVCADTSCAEPPEPYQCSGCETDALRSALAQAEGEVKALQAQLAERDRTIGEYREGLLVLLNLTREQRESSSRMVWMLSLKCPELAKEFFDHVP